MLSVVIPARNEVYLEKTIRDVLANARGEIEVLVMLDGYLPDPPINIGDDRVVFYHFKDPVGQRRCINDGAGRAKGKFIMKLDAHCAVAEGFDTVLSQDCQYDWTMVPRMYNLDAETWKPKIHKRTDYMFISSPEGEKPFRMSYFSGSLFREWHRRPELIDDTMCLVGCCFFMHRQRFWELGGCDEGHGGWGQQGIEVSCKAWLSGGRCVVNKKTWFAHYFRGGGGPGFPYPLSGRAVERARAYSRDLWLNDKWPLAKRKFQWMLDKFHPPGWRSMKPITELKDKYKGKTCHIVAKGPSVAHLNAADFDDGPVIAINEAVENVERISRAIHRGWKNDLYSLQKDRGFVRPRKSTLLLSEAQSKDAFPDYDNRYIFDTKLWFEGDEFSANCALKISQLFGCDKIKLMCFDACTHSDFNTLIGGKLVPHDVGKYKREGQRIRDLIEKDGLKVEWLTPRDLREHLRMLDVHLVMEKQNYPRWRGYSLRKLPNDMALYHEAMWKNRPDFIVETGTCNGGSTLFYADMFELIGNGRVISVDIAPINQPPHPRITYITGSSTDRDIIHRVREMIKGSSVMVVLDSDHSRVHVKRELVHYAPLVSKGQFLVVEDCHTRGRDAWYGPGEAANWFLNTHREWERTTFEEQFYSTVTRHGWFLRR